MTVPTPGQNEDDMWMSEAVDLARLGRPSPNPPVGAVVVRDGQVIGRGHHHCAGEDHAEIVAMRAAGDVTGATVYVTLEPCNHVGRTPPCTDALIAAKVKRVVIGCRDPNPHVTGGGLERLRAAGIEVVIGGDDKLTQQLIKPWSKYVTTGLPYVSLKLALSLDGRIASRSGHSKWITGPEARRRVHALRAINDAVAVGIGTALADDPELTVRDAPGPCPLRVIFDTQLRLPLGSRLVKTAPELPTWIVCGADAQQELSDALTEHGITVIRVAQSAEGRIEVKSALRALASRGIVSLMVEGGAELAGSLLATRLTDELHAFIAPILLGPRGRPGAVDWAGPATPSEAPRIARPQWELCGEDAYVHGFILYPDT